MYIGRRKWKDDSGLDISGERLPSREGMGVILDVKGANVSGSELVFQHVNCLILSPLNTL